MAILHFIYVLYYYFLAITKDVIEFCKFLKPCNSMHQTVGLPYSGASRSMNESPFSVSVCLHLSSIGVNEYSKLKVLPMHCKFSQCLFQICLIAKFIDALCYLQIWESTWKVCDLFKSRNVFRGHWEERKVRSIQRSSTLIVLFRVVFKHHLRNETCTGLDLLQRWAVSVKMHDQHEYHKDCCKRAICLTEQENVETKSKMRVVSNKWNTDNFLWRQDLVKLPYLLKSLVQWYYMHRKISKHWLLWFFAPSNSLISAVMFMALVYTPSLFMRSVLQLLKLNDLLEKWCFWYEKTLHILSIRLASTPWRN